MELVYNVWLAFNIVFGLWSSRNWLLWAYAMLSGHKFRQAEFGKILDLFVLISILSFMFTFHKSVFN